MTLCIFFATGVLFCLCAAEDGVAKRLHVDLLLLVPSCWRSFHRRDALRRSLGLLAGQLPPHAFAYRFLMAHSPDLATPLQDLEDAAAELRSHDDMALLGPHDCNPPLVSHQAFVLADREAATTYKVRHMFRWALERFLPNFLLKVDDDVHLRIDHFYQVVLPNLPPSGAYFGYMVAPDPTTDVDIVDYFQTSFPFTFALGMCWGVSVDIAALLAETTLPLKTHGSEDMSVGLWLMPFDGLQYIHIPFMHDHPHSKSPFNRSCSSDSIVVHRMDGHWDEVDWRTGLLHCKQHER